MSGRAQRELCGNRLASLSRRDHRSGLIRIRQAHLPHADKPRHLAPRHIRQTVRAWNGEHHCALVVRTRDGQATTAALAGWLPHSAPVMPVKGTSTQTEIETSRADPAVRSTISCAVTAIGQTTGPLSRASRPAASLVSQHPA